MNKDKITILTVIIMILIVFSCIFLRNKVEKYICDKNGGRFILSFGENNKCIYGDSNE